MPSSDSTQGRAFSVRTLGQGVPFAQHLAHQQNQTLSGAGRRRKLAAPPEAERPAPAAMAPVPPQPAPAPVPPQPGAAQGSTVQGSGQLISPPASEGRSYAIGAPDAGAEGPEPLDGPGGAVEVANRPQPQPVDDELPPEPLDNPRRLLVWPAPDVSTQQALSDRGYRPVIVHSREEVDAQIAAFPAALFVDPLTGPITRTALQSLRQAAVAAEVPVLVTAGLGQATRKRRTAPTRPCSSRRSPRATATSTPEGPGDRGARGDRPGADRDAGAARHAGRPGVGRQRGGRHRDPDAPEPGGDGPDAGTPCGAPGSSTGSAPTAR